MTTAEIKVRFARQKQHHPDANGGDCSTEDRLIEIIRPIIFGSRTRGIVRSPSQECRADHFLAST